MACLNCGSNKIEYDAAAGNAFCVSCGAVTEENTIVSEITFGESATGAAILQGTLVSNDSGRLAINVHYGKRNSVQSREKTLVNGRRVINHIATALNMSERYQEAAHRYFNLAVNANFNKGRPTQNVASVCLYIVCRQEKASYLLIDFSELLQVSVFSLGVTFVKLVRELNLILPMVDPSLYITRFAMLLEFGDKTQRVVADALRLVQRMDRDWIQTGRRPAGICGACLLVASRMHNFRRSCNEIIRVVKVSSQTIQERLKEFKQTPTSKLSLDDFRNVWLEEANDPPAFTRNRSRKRGRPGSKGDDIPLHTTVRHDDPRQWVHEQDPFDIAGMAEQKLEPGDELLLMEINKYVGNSQLRLLSQEMVQKREELPATPNDTGDKPEQKDPFSTNVGDWQDFDDDEVIHTILSATEVEEKTALWMVNNANYLKEQELKKALNDTRAMHIGQRKKRAKPGSSRIEPSTTAAEAARKLLTQKKLSKKINYAALDNLFEGPANGQTNRVKGESTVDSPGMLSPLPGGTRVQSPVNEIVEEEGEPLRTTGNQVNDEIVEEEEEDDEEFDEEFANPSAIYGDEYDDYNEDVD